LLGGRSDKLVTHFHVVPRIRMRGVLFPLFDKFH
jgi:hypothetical protein